MKPKTNGSIQRTQNLRHAQGEGPNWILIAGGALLSTLSVRIGCRIKQAFDVKRSNTARNMSKGNGNCSVQRSGTCELHSNIHRFSQDEEGCYRCLSGNLNGVMDTKHQPTGPMSKDGDPSLPLVKIPTAAESNKDSSGVMWASSPDRLELPQKPFHRSHSSDSPSFSESGSDIYSKREVIQKLRQQLKRRDDMIMEMQAQITDLRSSLNVQISHSSHLQSQIDSANRDLFDSEREIQRLRKAMADHCVAEVISPERRVTARNWQPEPMNGYLDGMDDDVEVVGNVSLEKGRDGERVEMLKLEVGELKEVIGGKDFLLQSYKEQKVELSEKVKELQLKLSSQVPNIF